MVFFCRNNGYAISTPTHEEFVGDGIISRAAGYGVRVDGNDLLAVCETVREEHRIAVESRPVQLEAMTYRKRDHSTDDSTAYKPSEKIAK